MKFMETNIVEEKGTLFRDWDNLFDIHEGKPPMPGIKY